jgi:hypothetical protein
MSMSGPNDTKQEPSSQEHASAHEHGGDDRASGEGAASALAHMISRGNQQQRHQPGEADDAAGSHRQ